MAFPADEVTLAAVHSGALFLLRSEDDFASPPGQWTRSSCREKHRQIRQSRSHYESPVALYAVAAKAEWHVAMDVSRESDGHHAGARFEILDEDDRRDRELEFRTFIASLHRIRSSRTGRR